MKEKWYLCSKTNLNSVYYYKKVEKINIGGVYMSAFISFYTLNTAEQLDLFLSEEGSLKLAALRESMLEKEAPVSNDGVVSGEGFISPNLLVRNEKNVLDSYCSSQGSLGYFNEARYLNENLTTERIQHRYYSKSYITITEDSDFIVKFDNSSEEATKGKVKSLIEELGFETSIFRFDDDLLRKVQKNYKWNAAKLDKIERLRDSTKRVSYEIDQADDQYPSHVNEEYREHGKLSHIAFELPYRAPGAPNFVTVKLYSQGHRIVLNEDELAGASLEEFTLFLLKKLKELKKEDES